jgi:hypothetical protein
MTARKDMINDALEFAIKLKKHSNLGVSFNIFNITTYTDDELNAVLDKKMSIAPNNDHKYYLLHLINADICAISGLLETDEFRWYINISYPTYMKDKIRKIYFAYGISYSENDIIQELKLNYKWPSMQAYQSLSLPLPQSLPQPLPPPRYQEPPPIYVREVGYASHDIEV